VWLSNLCYALTFCEAKINNNESLSRCILNRVLAPEGELLSFAPPKESSQRKGGPITAHVLRSSHLSGDGRMGFLPICRRAASMPHPLCPWVLRAIPDKYSGARSGKREKARYCSTSVKPVASQLCFKWSRFRFLVAWSAGILPASCGQDDRAPKTENLTVQSRCFQQ